MRRSLRKTYASPSRKISNGYAPRRISPHRKQKKSNDFLPEFLNFYYIVQQNIRTFRMEHTKCSKSGKVPTPKWVAEKMLQEMKYAECNDILGKHLMDNSCGDGALLSV